MSKSLGAIVHRFFDQDDHASAQQVPDPAPLLTRLDEVDRHLHALAEGMERLQSLAFNGHVPQPEESGVVVAPAGEGVVETLAALDRQIARAGREQLKFNTLAEAQREQLTAALDDLRAAGARRELEIEALREQTRAAQAAARLEMARALLPALDGLDEAMRSGRQLLERPIPAPRRSSWFGGTRAPDATAQQLQHDMDSWLVGLGYVRERLLAVLATEGIRPMPVVGQPFDPRLHMAMEVAPATAAAPAGTVTAVIRQGYLAGDRVLRHAEVAVAKGEGEPGESV